MHPGRVRALCAPNDTSALPRRTDKGSVDVDADHFAGAVGLSLLSHSMDAVNSRVGADSRGWLPISQVTQPSLHPISRIVAPRKMSFGSALRRESDAKGLLE